MYDELHEMAKTGTAVLYLHMNESYKMDDKPLGNCNGTHVLRNPRSNKLFWVSNVKVRTWDGRTIFHVRYIKTGGHNMTGIRYDVWFTGPDSTNWHGVSYGNNTMACHCRKVK